MNLLVDYIKEREKISYHEIKDIGFITWKIINDGTAIYIIDLYVIPGHRQRGFASKLADHVFGLAKEQGIEIVYGTIVGDVGDPTTSMKALLGYGFEIDYINGQTIWMRKNV